MSIFEDILKPYMKPPQPGPQDYYDEEGYLCCGICRTRRQYEVSIEGQKYRVPVPCKHIQEQREKEEAAEKLRKHQQWIKERLQDLQSWGASIQPKATFEQDDGNNRDVTNKIMGYAQRFDRAMENNLGLMIYGTPGTGKTFYAQCLANQLLQDNRFAWFSSIRLLSAAINQNHAELRKSLLYMIGRADLLILDDFGAERDTSYMAEQVFEIINTRYESGKPLVITTNLDPKCMAAEKDITARRVYERVMEMCAPIEVKGETRRKQIAARKMSDLKDILGLEA